MITNKLKNASLKLTFQREQILEYIISQKKHPTAEMIYKYIVNIIPHISKTTVYNNVKSLAKVGIIKAVKFIGETEVRYDGVVDNHHHFVCDKCGKIYDVNICCSHLHEKNIDGHIANNVYAYFTGVCKECKTAED